MRHWNSSFRIDRKEIGYDVEIYVVYFTVCGDVHEEQHKLPDAKEIIFLGIKFLSMVEGIVTDFSDLLWVAVAQPISHPSATLEW